MYYLFFWIFSGLVSPKDANLEINNSILTRSGWNAHPPGVTINVVSSPAINCSRVNGSCEKDLTRRNGSFFLLFLCRHFGFDMETSAYPADGFSTQSGAQSILLEEPSQVTKTLIKFTIVQSETFFYFLFHVIWLGKKILCSKLILDIQQYFSL